MPERMVSYVDPERAPLLPRNDTKKDADARNKPLSNAKLLVALSFTWIGSFLASLDSTITTTLSATIASDFHSLSLISWLGSSYLITLAATQPLSGKLSDIFGRRPSLIFCSLTFSLGATVSSTAISEKAIILGRVLSGIGGGGLNSLSTFIATDLIDHRRRGLWQGFGMVTYGAGLGLGGVVGGSINDAYGWRYAFLLLTPLALLSACGVYFCVPKYQSQKTKDAAFECESAMARIRRIDFLGAVLLVTALALFLCALNFENSGDRASSLMLRAALPVAACFLVGYIVVEMYFAKEPVIPLHLLANRSVLAASLASLFTSMSLYTTMYYFPLYFQIRGNAPTQAGLLLVPESFGAAMGSLSAGFVMRSTEYCGKLKVFMLAVFLCGPAGFAPNRMDTPIEFSEIFLFLNGLGFGGMLTTMTIALICAIDHQFQAIATGLLYLFRSTGAAVGVTLSGALFRYVLRSYTGVEDDELQDCMGSRSNCSVGQLNAYFTALNATFILAAGYAVFGLISGSFARNYELSSKYPTQASEGIREGEEYRREENRPREVGS